MAPPAHGVRRREPVVLAASVGVAPWEVAGRVPDGWWLVSALGLVGSVAQLLVSAGHVAGALGRRGAPAGPEPSAHVGRPGVFAGAPPRTRSSATATARLGLPRTKQEDDVLRLHAGDPGHVGPAARPQRSLRHCPPAPAGAARRARALPLTTRRRAPDVSHRVSVRPSSALSRRGVSPACWRWHAASTFRRR